ncbi:hypothetical protein ZWY2020_047313 [Hordeum vulgare]|nr:hypothetical protein ZWY2020_047313 [Hordeum vulgare]
MRSKETAAAHGAKDPANADPRLASESHKGGLIRWGCGDRCDRDRGGGAGLITIEMACKPCLETGRRAMDRALDPNYDPDDSPAANSNAPPTSEPLLAVADLSASAAAPAKAI